MHTGIKKSISLFLIFTLKLVTVIVVSVVVFPVVVIVDFVDFGKVEMI